MEYSLKKSLGQHFLTNEDYCQRIVDSLQAASGKVLEIGPGGGAITKYLLTRNFSEYQCVELDEEKVRYLTKTYPSLTSSILHADFLKMDKPYSGMFTIIGNFPYNISSQIMFRVLEWRTEVDEVVGMFQKEVAKRIASKEGSKEYGILSVLTQCYYDVTYLFDVPPEAFNPPPKVVSGVLRLQKKEVPVWNGNYNDFKKFVKIAFNQRRKTLRNGFKSYYPSDSLNDPIFNQRAEQLSVEQFVALYEQLTGSR